MTCFYCGTELPAGAMFCGECGRPVNTRGGRSPKGGAKAAAARAAMSAEVPERAEAAAAEPSADSPVEVSLSPVEASFSPVEASFSPVEESFSSVEAPFEVPAAELEPEPEAQVEPEVPVAPEPAVQPAFVAEPLVEPAARPVEPPAPSAPVPDLAPVAVAEEPIAEEPIADVPADVEYPPVEQAPEQAPLEYAPVEQAPLAPAVQPILEPRPTPAHDATAAAERCAQCGAPLGAADIFCPECGFVRQRSGGRARPNDTNILDPFPWGLPRPTEPVVTHHHPPVEFEPDQPPRAAAPDPAPAPFAEIADVAETRLVPRGPRGERFVLQFSTGESVSVSGSGLIGRNPVAEPGEYFDSLVAVVDPGRSVSKTHLEFGQDGTSFWVSDRYSGNGTVVREPDREPRRCEAGKRYRVVRGARVEIGEQFFIVS